MPPSPLGAERGVGYPALLGKGRAVVMGLRPARTNMLEWNTILPFLAGLVCGIPIGAALVIVLSATMLSSQRSQQEEAGGSQ